MSSINVLMLGARRTGKSSVLASMINQFEKISEDGSIFINPDNSTEGLLTSKLISLKKDFEKCRQQGSPSFMIDECATAVSDEYTFSISYNNSKGKEKVLTDVVFRDFPGEDMTSQSKIKEVKENIENADIILISIDTIHLMEENGRFSGFFNRAKEIYTLITSSDFIDEQNGLKMVLFVPLKCEKYYYERRMNEVNERIKKEFSELIAFLTNDNVKDRITVGITPILTMGGIEFSHFGTDESGKIKTNNVPMTYADGSFNHTALRPSEVYFSLYGARPQFSPKYCEQPVLYLLSFVVALSKAIRDEQKQSQDKYKIARYVGIAIAAIFEPPIGLGLAAGELLVAYSDKQVRKTFDKLSPNLKTSGDGYELLNDPFLLGSKSS